MSMYRVRTQILNATTGPALSTAFFDTAAGTAQDAADAVIAFWNTVRGAMANYSVINTLADVHTVNEANGLVTGLTSVTGASQSGSVAGDQLPQATQGLLRMRTGVFVAGRQIQGHVFIPGAMEGDSTATRPSAAYRLLLETAGAALIADATSHWVVWSRKNGQMYGVSSVGAWTEWAVLRSRRD